jgi:CHAT domain-containing protein
MGLGKKAKIKQYSDTMDQLIQQALEKRERATKLAGTTKKSIEEVRRLGIDVSRANGLLKKAQGILGDIQEMSQYDDVLKMLSDANNMATHSKSQYLYAAQSLKGARNTITEISEDGIHLEPQKELLSKAEAAFNNRQYASVKDLAERATSESKITKQNYFKASKLIKDAINKIHTAKNKGLVTKEAEKLLDDATNLMANNSYKTSVTVAQKSIISSENAPPIKGPEPKPTQPKPSYIPLSTPTPKPTAAPEEEKKPFLTLDYPSERTFKSGTWSKLELELSNKGNGSAMDIQLKLSEDVESRGARSIHRIKAGETKLVGIGIKTSEIGEIPINVDVSYKDPLTNEKMDFQEMIWINTETATASAFKDKSETDTMKMPKTEGEVKVLSEVEVFQGFVRLKVGIKNEMNMVITDAKFDLEYDDNAMRLDRIEPDFERKGHKINFGVIHPSEKRTVAFYLDPQICTESYVDGTLVYKDIYGELKTSAMKRRKAEVVCPILYTPENINTAMLNRMMTEELTVHDSKIYEIPPGIDFERAMSICKDTIQGHDLKFVRSFVEHDAEDPEIESWYYGTTKVKKHKVVIKASTRKKTNTIELFVACKDKHVITGFLAELGHNFNDKLKELGVIKQPIYPLTDEETREEISQTASLLQHQYSEKTTLSISKRGNEYEVSFKTSEERSDAAELCEFIKVSPDSRLDVIDQINNIVTVLNIFTCTRGTDLKPPEEVLKKVGVDELKDSLIEDKIRDLSSLGQLIYTMFLPVPIQNHLEKVKEPVILKTNDNEIPWELLHDDKDFLCLKVPIGRRLRSREIPRSNQVIESRKIRILFIANPTGDLEGAEEEVDYIVKHLDPNIEVEVLKGNQATNTSVLSALRSGKYDIIHYSGHAEFNADHPDESALICSNKRKIYAQEIKRIIGGKPFVFLNACGSGREKICEEGENYSGSDTEGLASSFILGGSLSVIGSSWPLPDISAGILASEFYNHVLSGDSVGSALHKARIHLKTERPDDINWMAFILYGDPTLKLLKNVNS